MRFLFVGSEALCELLLGMGYPIASASFSVEALINHGANTIRAGEKLSVIAIQAISDVLIVVFRYREQQFASAGTHTDPVWIVLQVFALGDKGASGVVQVVLNEMDTIRIRRDLQ